MTTGTPIAEVFSMKSRLLARILHTRIGLLTGISGASPQIPIPDAEMAARGPNLDGDRLQLARI